MAQDWSGDAVVYFCSAVGDLSVAVLYRALGLEFTDMKTIDEMARDAGFVLAGKLTTRIHGYDRDGDYTEELKAFAALVRADERADLYKEMNDPLVAMCKKMVTDEREECATLCENYGREAEMQAIGNDYAQEIRARGQA